MSTDMDAHGYIEEATQTLFEGSPRRSQANSLIAIAMLLETATDHLAYLAVKLAETPPDLVQEVTNYNTGEPCTCGQCGPVHLDPRDWRAEWQHRLDDVARETVVLPPRDTDNVHPWAHPSDAPHPYRDGPPQPT